MWARSRPRVERKRNNMPGMQPREMRFLWGGDPSNAATRGSFAIHGSFWKTTARRSENVRHRTRHARLHTTTKQKGLVDMLSVRARGQLLNMGLVLSRLQPWDLQQLHRFQMMIHTSFLASLFEWIQGKERAPLGCNGHSLIFL